MTLSLPTAVQTLAESGGKLGDDQRLQARLSEVQAVLGDELAWVEAALGESQNGDPEPARSAAQHLIQRGGKRIRPLCLLLSAACFTSSVPALARDLAVTAELVHSATLLHDDVVDEGDERRGAPAARKLFGNAVSVLSGDLLLVHALERTLSSAPEFMPSLVATLRRLVEGEVVQLRGRTALDVSETTYERILRDKTASLFAWAAESGARVGGADGEQSHALREFGEHLGIAFQLVDDVLDYAGENSGKSLLTDLCEGKLTLPLVIAVQRRPELESALRSIHAGQRQGISEISRAVVECGACDSVRQRAVQHTERAVQALDRAPRGAAQRLLESVARELARRCV